MCSKMLRVLLLLLWFRNGQKLVDKTADKIRNQQGFSRDYNFLSALLARKDLSYKDVSIITLSLFADGLNTVCYYPSVKYVTRGL